MSSHQIQLYHQEFDHVTGARNYRTACEPCNWLGPWRVKDTQAQSDADRHIRLEARHRRVINRNGRHFEVCVHNGALWLADWCHVCDQSLPGTAVAFRGDTAHVEKKLERAIASRLRKSPKEVQGTACRCGRKQSGFDADTVLAEICGTANDLELLNAERANA